MDGREMLINDIKVNMVGLIDVEQIGMIESVLIKTLAGYSIEHTGTGIALYDDVNERIIKRYSACLLLDGKSKGTIKIYISQIRKLSDSVKKHFTEFGVYDIKMYLGMLKERGVSNRTLENYRSYFSSFFQWMTNEEIISKNPCLKINPIKYHDEIKHPFSDTDIDKMRSSCECLRDRMIIEFLYSSGIRANEFVSLNIADVDIPSKKIHVRHGKGDKARICYISDVAAMYAEKYFQERNDDNNAIAISNRRKERLTQSGLKDILDRIEKQSHVNHVHPHKFRHTFAT